jgi:hypothetical protein
MKKRLREIRLKHAKERAALLARQQLELAITMTSARGRTIAQQCRLCGLGRSQIAYYRRIWRDYDPTKPQPWEKAFISQHDLFMRMIGPDTLERAFALLDKKGTSHEH